MKFLDQASVHSNLLCYPRLFVYIATYPFRFPWTPDPKHDSPLRKSQHLIFFIPFSFLFALWCVDTMQVVIMAVEDKRTAAKEELNALLAHNGIMLTLHTRTRKSFSTEIKYAFSLVLE